MARKPKAAPTNEPELSVDVSQPVPDDAAAPVRRGRKPKAAAASAQADQTDQADATASPPSVPMMDDTPARGRRGRKPKGQGEAAAPSLLQEALEQQPEVDQPQGAPDSDDAMIAEMAYPVAADDGSTSPADAEAPASPVQGTPQAEPAAKWDRATDTVRFDWAAIERTASQDGPNQAMAKLLVAARAEGANSRWPL